MVPNVVPALPKCAVMLNREDPGIDRMMILQHDTLQNQEHLQPNVITYSAAISACEQALGVLGVTKAMEGMAEPQPDLTK